MIPVSDQFRQALTRSHQVVTKLEVLDAAGDTIPSNLAPVNGAVTLDRKAAYRRTLSLDLAGLSLIPDGVDDLLSPYGHQIRVYTGIRFTDSTEELVPLGTFRIQDVTGDRDLGEVHVEGYSVAATVAEDQFLIPMASDPILTVQEQIEFLILESIPGAVVLLEATEDRGMAAGVVWEQDRWKAITGTDASSLAVSIGAEVWISNLDEFVIRDVPRVDDPPVLTVRAGEGGALVSAPVTLSRDDVRNAWVVSGQSTSQDVPPVRAIEYDDNPLSATRWDGPFGHVPGFFSSPNLTTSAECLITAQALLADSLGLAKSIDLTAIPDPTLEPCDVITVEYADGRTEDHLIDTVTIPLVADGQYTCRTRAQTYQAT